MREIKFRAWDEVRMQYFDLRNGYPANWTGWKNVMQYTGLKDKNGKEIYEGDILQGHSPDDDYDEENKSWLYDGFKTQVKFKEGGFIVDCVTGDFDETTIGWAMDAGFSYEIIGNVYENKDLL